MKKNSLPFLFLLLPFWAFSQSNWIRSLLSKMAVDTVDKVYAIEDPDKLYVPVDFGKSTLRKLPETVQLEVNNIERVSLVYTNFPKNIWSTQVELNIKRIESLYGQLPVLKEIPSSKWRVIMQNEVENALEAKELFHGFIIETNLNLKPDSELPNFLDETSLYYISRGDSTVSKVFNRNSNWKNMLVVTDLTGSMAPFTAQLLLWLKLNERKRFVDYFVFFNDGDMAFEEDKVIGNTGGIYGGKASSFEDVAKLAQLTVVNGSGGDYKENDIEAVLSGINSCETCQDVVIIADNRASPRDMVLLSKVTKPVRVLLCGTEEGINTDYLNIALQTGGTIHTIEEDLIDLVKLNEGESIRIGKEVFIIKGGKFEYLKKM